MKPGRYGGSALAWAALLAYASLYPFWPWRLPPAQKLREVFQLAGMVVRADVAFNIVAYVPFGMLLCLHFRGEEDDRPGLAMLKAAAIAGAFSATMEGLQLFIPGRVSSVVDLMTNFTGALVGSLVFGDPVYSMATRPLGEARDRLVIPGGYGDAALMLVMLWLIAQLNPALPFFAAGDLATEIEPDLVALRWAAVAMGICGFGLFISTVMRDDTHSLRSTAGLLSLALWLKFVMATSVLQPHAAGDWLRGGWVEGVAVGLAAFVPLRKLARTTRCYLGLILILAGALFAKVFGTYSAMEGLRRLFRWPYGQVEAFASLTRFIHELWPFAAVTFLVALYLHARRVPPPPADRIPP